MKKVIFVIAILISVSFASPQNEVLDKEELKVVKNVAIEICEVLVSLQPRLFAPYITEEEMPMFNNLLQEFEKLSKEDKENFWKKMEEEIQDIRCSEDTKVKKIADNRYEIIFSPKDSPSILRKTKDGSWKIFGIFR